MPLVNDDPVEEMVEIGEEDWVPDPGERKDKYKYRAVLRMRRGYKWGGGRYRAITGSEETKREVYQLTGHGAEPLGEVQKALRAGLPHWDGKLPQDTGYDTDWRGVGYNSIYLVVEKGGEQ